ncbi:hypothetical protein K439DRAFT_797148 [Ramaria rubella]|nr:hypothetical protein K439DRAFT_797148 [Ramaria rubella]
MSFPSSGHPHIFDHSCWPPQPALGNQHPQAYGENKSQIQYHGHLENHLVHYKGENIGFGTEKNIVLKEINDDNYLEIHSTDEGYETVMRTLSSSNAYSTPSNSDDLVPFTKHLPYADFGVRHEPTIIDGTMSNVLIDKFLKKTRGQDIYQCLWPVECCRHGNHSPTDSKGEGCRWRTSCQKEMKTSKENARVHVREVHLGRTAVFFCVAW